MVYEEKGPKKEEKEEETQAEMLRRDLFPTLYSKLNLDQFVKDKESGTVDTQKLQEYLEFLGFSSETITLVLDCLSGKGNPKATQITIYLEYTHNPNIQKKSEEYNSLVESVKKDLITAIPNEQLRETLAYPISFYLYKNWNAELKDENLPVLKNLSVNLVLMIEGIPMNAIYKEEIISAVMRLQFSKNTEKELYNLQNFKKEELTGENAIIVENSVEIGKKAGEIWNVLRSTNEEEIKEALDKWHNYLLYIGISEETAENMAAQLLGIVAAELIKKGEVDKAKKLYEIGKNVLVGAYGMSLDEFNKSFMEGFVAFLSPESDEFNKSFMEGFGGSLSPESDVSKIETAKELLMRASGILNPDYLFVYIETVLRPLFGGTEEMQAGEAVMNQEEKIKEIIAQLGVENAKNIAELIKKEINNLENKIKEGVSRDEEKRIDDKIEYLDKLLEMNRME